jgi:hypothetical protein
MKTKRNDTKLIALPAKSLHEASLFAPSEELKSVWKDMPNNKAKYVQDEIRQLAAARMAHAQSGLALGQHLHNIYSTCEPYSGAFMRICKSFSFSWRTAYRYMETWRNAQKAFPEPVLKAAMIRGLKVLSYNNQEPLGKFTKAVKLLPPPKNPTPTEAHDYIVKLEQKQREIRDDSKAGIEAMPADKDELLRQSFRMGRNALQSLKGRAKRSYLDTLVGMLLTEAGIASLTQFEPEAIPDDFRRGPGRPRSLTESAA